jgi:hypothetical protein
MGILAGSGLALLALMFLPVLIALLRGRLLVAFVVFVMVLVSIVAIAFPVLAIVIWLAALCIGAFAGQKKVIVIERPR